MTSQIIKLVIFILAFLIGVIVAQEGYQFFFGEEEEFHCVASSASEVLNIAPIVFKG